LTKRFDKLAQKLISMPSKLGAISADNMSVDSQQADDEASSSAQASGANQDASPDKEGEQHANGEDGSGEQNDAEMSADTTMMCNSCE
jgi:hypothetical protein